MNSTTLKLDNLDKTTYLNERLLLSDLHVQGNATKLSENWMKKSGLKLEAFQERLHRNGFSYNQFLNVLERKNSPSPMSFEWHKTLEDIFSYIDIDFLKSNITTADIGVFVLPFTNYFADNIRKHTSSLDEDCINLESFIYSCENYLFQELKQITDKTIVLEFHKLKEKSSNNEHNIDLNFYKEFYLTDANYIQKILNTYPVIARILTELTTRTIANIKHLIDRYIRDYQSIEKLFFSKKVVLQSVSFGLGDSHKNGQTVAILQFQNGEKLVYKPRSLNIDIAFNQFLDWINPNLTISLKNGKSISPGEYGWQEFITSKNCKCQKDVNQYYYRMGAYIAIFHLLRSNDMHYENVIACGSTPHIIDLETLFSNSAFSEKILQYPRRELLKTVLSSGILPTGQVFSSRVDFDPSGLVGKTNQKSHNMRGWVLVEDNEAELKYENKSFVTSVESHLVKINGEFVNPVDFIEDIEKGFTDVYQVFLDNKDILFEKIIEFFGEVECRIVLRPTFMYSRFLLASQHPTYLKNGLDREGLLEMLWNITKAEPNFERIVESEIQDLLNNDVPYFTYFVNSKSLLDSKKKVIENIFEQTSMETVEEQISHLSNEDLNEQLRLISLSIHSNDVAETEANKAETLPSPCFKGRKGDVTFLEVAEEIGDHLSENIIRDKSKQYVSWAGVENIDNIFKFTSLDFSLYNGMLGISLYLAHLYKYIPKKIYKDTVYKNINFLNDTMRTIEGNMPNSMFNGIGSFAYTLYSLSSLFEDETLYDLGNDYLLMMSNLEEDEDAKNKDIEEFDFLDGYAGIITFCVNLYETHGIELALSLAEKYGKKLMSYLQHKHSELILGLAHGTSGIVIALRKLGSVFKDQNMLDTVSKLINYEDSHFDNQKLNWLDLRENVAEKTKSFYWCHGAPGILLSRAFTDSKYVQGKTLETDVLNNFLDFHLDVERISLCHGTFGNFDMLINIGQKHSDLLPLTQIKNSALSYLQQEKVQAIIQGMKERGLIGLMIGVSGVGYSLLRMHDPKNVPSILTLELPTVRMNTQ
ncbi:type 2 lanthipeptide synthetase LanM family protein (plasmid) [Priestia megaterium]|uniref:type 2 lanthipeptide synthetase LanM family protein n=1 Tax=Priestia megaterium TaxID=1404 RepID=UPI00351E8542